MTCPSCKRAFTPTSHPGGRCEEVNRGRRFFLMGALALPVAAKVTIAAPAVHAYEITATYTARTWAGAIVISPEAMADVFYPSIKEAIADMTADALSAGVTQWFALAK